jgi:hypothetical protein
MRAVAPAGGWGQPVTGMADGTDQETTARARGGGPVTRQGRRDETPG